jgi:hypothetical protein
VKFIFEKVQENLKSQIDGHVEALSWGKAENMTQYGELVGAIKGLRIASQEVADVEILINKQEEDD